MPSTYSSIWFELFLEPIQPVRTAAEVAFVARHLPLPTYQSVLDLCCGWGRHAGLLAERGYQVTAVDRDPQAIAEAQRRTAGRGITCLVRDMRSVADLPAPYSAVICLWQSFGYFDEATNAEVLRRISQTLPPRGRVILDLYHRAFFETHQGIRIIERNSLTITERKSMRGDRLTVSLDYGPGHGADIFEWQLYTPDSLRTLANRCGFACLMACSRFDDRMPATANDSRTQIVLEKTEDQMVNNANGRNTCPGS